MFTNSNIHTLQHTATNNNGSTTITVVQDPGFSNFQAQILQRSPNAGRSDGFVPFSGRANYLHPQSGPVEDVTSHVVTGVTELAPDPVTVQTSTVNLGNTVLNTLVEATVNNPESYQFSSTITGSNENSTIIESSGQAGTLTGIRSWISDIFAPGQSQEFIQNFTVELGLNHDQHLIRISTGVENIMSSGLQNLLLAMQHSQLRERMTEAVQFANQSYIFNYGGVVINSRTRRIDFIRTQENIQNMFSRLDFDRVYSQAADFMSSFSDLMFLMGEQAINEFIQLINLSPTTTLLVILIHYPHFMGRTMPLHLLNSLTLNQLRCLVRIGLETARSRIGSLNTLIESERILIEGNSTLEQNASNIIRETRTQLIEVSNHAQAANEVVAQNQRNNGNVLVRGVASISRWANTGMGRLTIGAGLFYIIPNIGNFWRLWPLGRLITAPQTLIPAPRELPPIELPQVPIAIDNDTKLEILRQIGRLIRTLFGI